MSRMEYGGCLWFDFGTSGEDYYASYKDRRIEVDCGRSAIQYLLQNNKYKRIWLPVYNCPLVFERINRTCDIVVEFYNIREDFYPNINYENLQKGDALLWVNYCGVMQDDLIDKVAQLGDVTDADVIIDNIPAFFSHPRMSVYNIYSCRKFIGVPDGGFLIGNDVKPTVLPRYETANNYLYLLKAIECGSNAVYTNYLESEKRITEEEIAYGMPQLTEKILGTIDYEKIKTRRYNNFMTLHKILGDRNTMNFNYKSKTASVYPYLSNNIEIRNRLLSKRVFVSRFWAHVLKNKKANKFEKKMAEYLIPLPIDQRYTEEDMERIAEIVIEQEY